MPQIVSRVNGLVIAIPNDARNVLHRFAIGGGGNELVFEPVKRSDFDQSAKGDTKPVGLGIQEDATQSEKHAVELTLNVEEDETPTETTPPKRTRRRKTIDEDQGEISL